jgi:drug/metabolite transporter (DMT)-like permease
VTVSGRSLVKRYPPFPLMGLMMFSGFLCTTLVQSRTILTTDFTAISAPVWWAVIYLAAGCSVFSYTVWYMIIRSVPVNEVALSLFLQPIFGVILGRVLLHETVSLRTLIGASIVCGVLVWWQLRRRSSPPEPQLTREA